MRIWTIFNPPTIQSRCFVLIIKYYHKIPDPPQPMAVTSFMNNPLIQNISDLSEMDNYKNNLDFDNKTHYIYVLYTSK